MTEKEKDAFIVQLRGEVTMYRDAYRLAKYQLDEKRTRCREERCGVRVPIAPYSTQRRTYEV